MISITNIIHPTGSPLISPCHAISDITVPTETGDKLIPTQGRGFSRFSAGMHFKAYEGDYHHKCVRFQQHGNQ